MSSINCVLGIEICGGDAVIKKCDIKGCTSSGLVFRSSTSRSMVSNARIEDCHDGISCMQGSIVNVSNCIITRCGGSGITAEHHCNILIDQSTIEVVNEHFVSLAEFCFAKLSKCAFRAAVGGGVVVKPRSSLAVHDSSILECGGAGVESAGKVSMSSTSCSHNSSGVVLLQLSEAQFTNCIFAGNNLAGVWSIGDACDVRSCVFEGNRCCAYTAGKNTKFVEENCSLLANGSTSSFLVWKTGKRSVAVQVACSLRLT